MAMPIRSAAKVVRSARGDRVPQSSEESGQGPPLAQKLPNLVPVVLQRMSADACLQSLPDLVDQRAMQHSVGRLAGPRLKELNGGGSCFAWRGGPQQDFFLGVAGAVGEPTQGGALRRLVLVVHVAEKAFGQLPIDRGGGLRIADHWRPEGVNLMNGDYLALEAPRGQQRQRAAEAVTGDPDRAVVFLAFRLHGLEQRVPDTAQ